MGASWMRPVDWDAELDGQFAQAPHAPAFRRACCRQPRYARNAAAAQAIKMARKSCIEAKTAALGNTRQPPASPGYVLVRPYKSREPRQSRGLTGPSPLF